MDDHEDDAQRFLSIYLQDHRTGAEAGVRLAQRCRDHATDPELARLVDDIDQDRRTLAKIMAGLDVQPSVVKQVAGLTAERLGRLKLNGRAVRTSPLSVLIELEGLVGAVSVKRQLWATLRSLAADGAGHESDFDELIARAEDQRGRLDALHRRAVTKVFEANASRRSDDGPEPRADTAQVADGQQ